MQLFMEENFFFDIVCYDTITVALLLAITNASKIILGRFFSIETESSVSRFCKYWMVVTFNKLLSDVEFQRSSTIHKIYAFINN